MSEIPLTLRFRPEHILSQIQDRLPTNRDPKRKDVQQAIKALGEEKPSYYISNAGNLRFHLAIEVLVCFEAKQKSRRSPDTLDSSPVPKRVRRHNLAPPSRYDDVLPKGRSVASSSSGLSSDDVGTDSEDEEQVVPADVDHGQIVLGAATDSRHYAPITDGSGLAGCPDDLVCNHAEDLQPGWRARQHGPDFFKERPGYIACQFGCGKYFRNLDWLELHYRKSSKSHFMNYTQCHLMTNKTEGPKRSHLSLPCPVIQYAADRHGLTVDCDFTYGTKLGGVKLFMHLAANHQDILHDSEHRCPFHNSIGYPSRESLLLHLVNHKYLTEISEARRKPELTKSDPAMLFSAPQPDIGIPFADGIHIIIAMRWSGSIDMSARSIALDEAPAYTKDVYAWLGMGKDPVVQLVASPAACPSFLVPSTVSELGWPDRECARQWVISENTRLGRAKACSFRNAKKYTYDLAEAMTRAAVSSPGGVFVVHIRGLDGVTCHWERFLDFFDRLPACVLLYTIPIHSRVKDASEVKSLQGDGLWQGLR